MKTIATAFFIGLGAFGVIWWYVTKDAIKTFGKNASITFTPKDGAGGFVSFDTRHERYMKIAEVMTTLASASLIFLPGSRLAVYTHSCAFALSLLGFSVLYSVGFMAALTYFYEGFLYDNESYKPWKYGLVHAFGFGGLLCFAVAYIFLAVRVAWAVIYTIAPTAANKIP